MAIQAGERVSFTGGHRYDTERPKVSGWKTIDSAPRGEPGKCNRGPRIMLANAHFAYFGRFWWYADGKSGRWKAEGYNFTPTHWQNMPELPSKPET